MINGRRSAFQAYGSKSTYELLGFKGVALEMRESTNERTRRFVGKNFDCSWNCWYSRDSCKYYCDRQSDYAKQQSRQREERQVEIPVDKQQKSNRHVLPTTVAFLSN